jgi:hypothetical protein
VTFAFLHGRPALEKSISSFPHILGVLYAGAILGEDLNKGTITSQRAWGHQPHGIGTKTDTNGIEQSPQK